MAHKPAASGVFERAGVFELVQLSDVVEYRSALEQFLIQSGVVVRDPPGKLHKGCDVLQKSAHVGVVHHHGCRGEFDPSGELRVFQQAEEKLP